MSSKGFMCSKVFRNNIPERKNAKTYIKEGPSRRSSNGIMYIITGVTMIGLLYQMNKNTYAAEKNIPPIHGVPGTKLERTLIVVKPDGVQRGLISEVIRRFERKGYRLVGCKMFHPTREFAEQHYTDVKERPFFPKIINFFSSGPVVAMVWEGYGVIQGGRTITISIREDFRVRRVKSIVHGSSTHACAEIEIKLWFKEEEIVLTAEVLPNGLL